MRLVLLLAAAASGLLRAPQRRARAGLHAAGGDVEPFGGALSKEADAAARCVRAAVRACLDVQASLAVARDQKDSLGKGVDASAVSKGKAAVKADATPVTAADFGIQGYVSAVLLKHFAGDRFMGEEDAADLRLDADLRANSFAIAKACAESEDLPLSEALFVGCVDRGVEDKASDDKRRCWILDPIDGTKGLITGQQYIIGLALVDSFGDTLVACMGNPSVPDFPIMVAVKGKGLRYFSLDDAPGVERISKAPWKPNYDYSKLAGLSDESALRTPGVDFPPFLLSRPMDAGSPLPFGPFAAPSTICCGALIKYWAVARNEVAGFIQYETTLKSWDHAAGLLCVSESGGTATDGAGAPVRFDAREVAVKGAVVCCAQAASEKTRQLFRQAAKPA
ncbi:hypothetical protein M885DRAFT_514249 [Pelagophyceae sp. CCMP2097]|nr:hypothetical protein M885DRAFT_514249 [Pelagophyceae sp. CCMP2097]|mmetsp:Transcript_9289/g.30723  ORF Transcript_9289/g.30723 Transcript_9289/m.30723 type:complete len:394 (+) Transcript_9289:43-1224(+)